MNGWSAAVVVAAAAASGWEYAPRVLASGAERGWGARISYELRGEGVCEREERELKPDKRCGGCQQLVRMCN